MSIVAHNPAGAFPPYRGYAHAVEVPAGARTLYISGLNGYERDGVPSYFAGQAEWVWRHLGTILESAAMGYSDVVSLRFFLASAADDPANVDILYSLWTATSPPALSLFSSCWTPPGSSRSRRSPQRWTKLRSSEAA
jgi:2-iminobutanoate/2-iminopropanoate deaminase